MTVDQLWIILILAGAMAAFALNRWRTEVVAVAALSAAVLAGLVNFSSVFAGFSNSAVITVVEILMLTQLLARSGLVDRVARPILSRLASERQLILFLACGGAGLSVFMNNIGALAIMLPLAYAGCRRLGVAPQTVLMPLSFATLLGGMCSLIGTPANLVVSGAREENLGAPMGFFVFAVVGLPAVLAGLLWLGLFHGERGARGSGGGEHPREEDEAVERIVFEWPVSKDAAWVGKSLEEIEREESIEILNVVRREEFVFARRDDIRLQAGDIIVLAAPHRLFDRLWKGDENSVGDHRAWPIREAVVTPSSVVLGSTVGSIAPFDTHSVEVIGVRGANLRVDGRFADIKISIGDVLLLQGDDDAFAGALEQAGCLALAGRSDTPPGRITPFAAIALGCGILLSATQITPPEIAFGLSLAGMAIAGAASLPELLRRIDWRVVIMLAALIPLAHAFETTGAAAAMAGPILQLALSDKVMLALALWAVATLITPFLNNVATAAILAPIALAAAEASNASPDMLLLAVAAGASTDFLTPFGHHNNTVVMGAAGYELRDFLRRGAPLTVITGVVTVLSLAIFY